jgi:hypothetical protein
MFSLEQPLLITGMMNESNLLKKKLIGLWDILNFILKSNRFFIKLIDYGLSYIRSKPC